MDSSSWSMNKQR